MDQYPFGSLNRIVMMDSWTYHQQILRGGAGEGAVPVPGVRGDRRQGGQEVRGLRRARAARRVRRPDQEEAGAPRVRRRRRPAARMERKPDRASAGNHLYRGPVPLEAGPCLIAE